MPPIFHYIVDNFVSTPTVQDTQIRIFDRNGTLKHIIDPRIAFFMVIDNILQINIKNQSDDINLDFATIEDAKRAIIKANDAKQIILANHTARSPYIDKVYTATNGNIPVFEGGGLKDDGIQLNDSGFGAKILWSALKIMNYVTGITSAWIKDPFLSYLYTTNNVGIGISTAQPDAFTVSGDTSLMGDLKVSGDTYLYNLVTNTMKESSVHIDSSGKTILGTLYRDSIYFTGITNVDSFDDVSADACIWEYFISGYNIPVFNSSASTNISLYDKFVITGDELVGVNDSFIVRINLSSNSTSNFGVGAYSSPKKSIISKNGDFYVGTDDKILVFNSNGTFNKNINFGSTEYSSYASKLIGNYLYLTTQYNFYVVDVTSTVSSSIVTGITFADDSSSTILNFSNSGQYFYVPKFYNDGLLTYSDTVSVIWTDNVTISNTTNLTTDIYGPKSTFVHTVNNTEYLFISSLSDTTTGRIIVYDLTIPSAPVWFKTVELDFIPNDITCDGYFLYITCDDGQVREYFMKDMNLWISMENITISVSITTCISSYNDRIIVLSDKLYNYISSKYGARAGTIMSCWNAVTNEIDYNSVSTKTSFGSGSLSDFDAAIESDKVVLKSSMLGNWFVRYTRRFI